jgi:hypothetical protein
MYEQVLDPVGGSPFATAIFAALPLIALFVLLGGFKLKAHRAALAALASRSPTSWLGVAVTGCGTSSNSLSVMCVLVLLQSTAALSWMVV